MFYGTMTKISKKNALTLAAIYTVTIGIGMYISLHWGGYSYGDPKFVKFLIWVELVLLALAIFWTKKFYSWKLIGLVCVANKKEFLWILPPIIALGYVWFVFISDFQLIDGFFNIFILIGITTLLVGISEEIVYRGVVLRSFLKSGNVWQAMLVSALTFSLLHSVNYFGGVSAEGVALQLTSTLIFGLFFASLAIRLGSLLPIIIFHSLWDFISIGGSATLNGAPIALIASIFIPLILIETVILWISIWKFPPKSLSSNATTQSMGAR